MFRIIFIIPLIFISLSTPAHAECKFYEYRCKSESQSRVRASELESGEIVSTQDAAKSINQFEFVRLTERPAIGYSQVTYSMVDRGLNKYSDTVDNAQEIVSRSLLDWVKSIFRTRGKIFVVSIDVYADDAETQLLAHKPLIIVEHSDSYRSIIAQNDISLNGRLGYPRLSNRAHRVKLGVRFANTSDVSLDEVGNLLSAANALSKVVPTVGSLVDEATLIAFNSARSNLEAVLGKFESSTTMSRSLTMRHGEDQIVAFNYDFRAPNERNLPRVKLSVALSHQQSLLVDGGVTLPGDILNVEVHEKDDDVISLRKYIQTNDISADDVTELATASPDVAKICQQIREALSQRLTATDQTVALNAFVSEYQNQFRKNWTEGNTCFLPQDIALIGNLGLEYASIWKENQPGKIVQLSLEEQLRFVKGLSDALKVEVPGNIVGPVVDGVVSKIPENQEIVFVDKVGFLLGESFSMQASSLVRLLIQSEKRLERGFGCFSGDQFDVDKQPNVLGTLSMLDGKPIEFIFEFSASPTSRRKPELNRLIVQWPSGDRLLKYRDGTKERSRNGCAGGFKPWDIQMEAT
ncbi:hypothetical protein [Pseudophaeobacter sp.]|uniref:hypothetical protein n=1 Tax=Pseudophaeobacter sp. TaxID=1971739 RepID=UPI00261A2157|nr:hypothetical protein [Pseudophaeobacter sp.]